MSRISPRPYNVAFGVPGNTNAVSHPGQPSAHRHSHHKLATPDPRAMEAELSSSWGNPLGRSKALIEKVRATGEETVTKAPRAKAGRLMAWLGRKSAALVGMGRGKPLPHPKMVRYAGTSPGDAGHEEGKTQVMGETPTTIAQINEQLIRRFEQGDQCLKAAIDKRRVAEVDGAVMREVQCARDSVALRVRRAENLSNQAAELARLRGTILQRMARRSEQAREAAALLAEMDGQVRSAKETLADGIRKHDEGRQIARLTLLETISRVEERLERTREAGNAAAKALFFGRAAPERSQLEEAVACANSKIARLESGLAAARNRLCMFDRGHMQSPVSGATSQAPRSPSFPKEVQIAEDLARQVASQEARLSQLQRSLTVQRALVERFATDESRLERELRRIDEKSGQVEQWAIANAAELWDAEEELSALDALPESLTEVIATTATKLSDTTEAQEAACLALDGAKVVLIGHLAEALPGFDASGKTAESVEMLTAWVRSLSERVNGFGDEALSPADAGAIGMQVLSIAADGDATVAAEVLRRLKTASLRDLVPLPGTDAGAVEVFRERAVLGAACLLAGVPRGMQVLSHMLRWEGSSVSKELLDAVQIYLRTQTCLEREDCSDADTLRWLAVAQAGAQHAVHGASVTEGLAGASAAERGAYHAFRNGYESRATGSNYERVNAHLRMFVQWLQAGATGSSCRESGGLNPLRSLWEGMRAAGAEALPTPHRRASEELGCAAEHLASFLVARRRAQLDAGFRPSPTDLTIQALAEYVQQLPSEKDLVRFKLGAKAIRAIERRRDELQAHCVFRAEEKDLPEAHADLPEAHAHPAFDEVLKAIRSRSLSVFDVMTSLQRTMFAHPRVLVGPRDDDGCAANHSEGAALARFHRAVGNAKRLMYDGDPRRVRSPQALFDFLRDFLEKLEWRDKVRFTEQRVSGLNLSPLSAALAVIPTGLGLKLIVSGQKSDDRALEIYMGRTGLSLQIGKQSSRQVQIGAGLGGGYVVPGTDEAPVGIGISADWRVKRDSSIEEGVQIRVPRRRKGQELEQRAQFLSMFEHLTRLAADTSSGPLEQRDLLGELLAYHPSITVGVIAGAQRESRSVESSLAATAGVRVGDVENAPRRVTFGVSVGVKTKRDKVTTSTPVEGYMTMLAKDSTAQTRVEGGVRVGGGVMLQQFKQDSGEAGQQGGGVRSDKAPKAIARLSAGILDAAYARELYAFGVTAFSTLWLFNNEIDPVRSDRGFEFQTFSDFERNVRENWEFWVNYGIPKLKGQVDEKMEYLVAERMLEDFIKKVREHTRDNKFASMIVDWAMKAEAAPHLDALRAQSQLLRMAGREEEAAEMDRAFDDLMAHSALWEPTILILREKGKRQRERGIDFFVKRQTNRLGESMRTVGQWIPYEPVPRGLPSAT